MQIYLAGPLGFSEAGRHFLYDVMVPALERAGYTVADPWKLTDPSEMRTLEALAPGPERHAAWRKLSGDIGARNVAAIDACHAVVAVLDGVDVDSGTASEIGYAFARQKTIVGYRGDFRLSSENEALVVNLQVEYFIRCGGGDIAKDVAGLLRILRSVAAAG